MLYLEHRSVYLYTGAGVFNHQVADTQIVPGCFRITTSLRSTSLVLARAQMLPNGLPSTTRIAATLPASSVPISCLRLQKRAVCLIAATTIYSGVILAPCIHSISMPPPRVRVSASRCGGLHAAKRPAATASLMKRCREMHRGQGAGLWLLSLIGFFCPIDPSPRCLTPCIESKKHSVWH
jgi:hypothetical protein